VENVSLTETVLGYKSGLHRRLKARAFSLAGSRKGVWSFYLTE
jgi:hypothetical protein